MEGAPDPKWKLRLMNTTPAMTVEAITNGIVIAGAVVVYAVITYGALTGPKPSGRLTWTATRFESLSGWRLLAVAFMGWLGVALLTIVLWIPIPLRMSNAGSTIARVAGLLLFLAAVLLILWGRHTLGPLWTVTTSKGVRLQRGHRLIREGPYAIVRHPMYLGYWLFVAGPLMIYRTWVLAGYLAVIIPRFLGRARMEDRALAEEFGQDWTDYARQVPMLIARWPFLREDNTVIRM